MVSGTIVVTDADERAALAVTRSLGRAGWRIVTCGNAPTSLAGRSRYSMRSVRVPDALREPDAFAERVVALALRGRGAVRHPDRRGGPPGTAAKA